MAFCNTYLDREKRFNPWKLLNGDNYLFIFEKELMCLIQSINMPTFRGA